MENLTGQGKAQGAKTEQDEPKFNQWKIEPREDGRRPLEIRTIDKLNGADVGILLCKTDQESDAKHIVKCMNNEWKIDMHKELVEALRMMKSELETLRLEDGIKKDISNERINMLSASLFSANKVLKQIEQK